MTGTQQVHIKPNRARNTSGKLPKKRIARVYVSALAIRSAHEPAFLCGFSRVMGGQQGLKMVVPLVHEVKASFLHPSIKIGLANLIGKTEDAVIGRKNLDRSLFH